MSFHTRLFVGNIPKSLSENDLREAFTSYGEIINLDIKQKPGAENDEKRFAFLTLSASNYEVESCRCYNCSVYYLYAIHNTDEIILNVFKA